MSTRLAGYGLFQRDTLIAVVPAPPKMPDPQALTSGRTKEGPFGARVVLDYQGEAPVLSDQAVAEGLRWSLLWEVLP